MLSSRKKHGFATSGQGSTGKFERTKPAQDFHLTYSYWHLVVGTGLLLFVITDVNYKSYPRVHDEGQIAEFTEKGLHPFIESNARRFLESVCMHGTRHVGSYVNEVVVEKKLMSEITAVKEKANQAHSIESDVQLASGCFDIDFRGNSTSCYTGVTNVLVKISPSVAKESTPAVLVSCHFDSAVSSPGKKGVATSSQLVPAGLW